MDDLYCDLENYNDVAVLAELKSENMELKLKVQEYTTAMDKLQKNILQDFDLLSSEFKKLEYNYSSLLKTAKSEIERKTQIITNINMEKDMLVLSALKNGDKSVLNIKKNIPAMNKNTLKNKWSEAVNKKQVNNAKEMQDDRSKKCHLDSKSVESERSNLNEKVDYLSVDAFQQDSQRNKEDRKRHMFEDRHSSKESEISRDDKCLGYNEPSRDLYKGRIHKYYDSDKRRSRNKYDTSEKFKRYSSERYKKHSTDYYEYSHRTDFGRSRIQTSPPVDRFYHHSYKERQQENERIHLNENDKYTNSKERFLGKHKASYYEYEEPNKRQKTGYYGRPKENVRLHGEETENQELTETFERLQKQYTSCQSPDYIYNDMTSEPIKVIRDTAETPLEDPRLVTSKYILTNENGSECLSIAKGRDIELIPIDKEKWNIQKLGMPRALTFPLIEEQHVKELCILNEQLNLIMSRESIESQVKLVDQEAVDSQDLLNKHLTKDEHTANKCHEDMNKASLTKKGIENIENPSQTCLGSNKIPSVKKCGQVSKSKIFKTEKSLDVIEDIFGKDTKNCELKSSNKINLANIHIHDSIGANDVRNCNKTGVFQNSTKIHGNQSVLSTREIVEGDLELSDETCDNTELQKMINESGGLNKKYPSPQSNKTRHTESKNTSTQSMVLISQLEQQEDIPSKSNTNYKHNIACIENEKSLPCDKTEEHIEGSKKQKNKKKIHKNKESERLEVIEKKMKSKKDKPMDVKSKFNDLFGDSNSLITPDDLGIPLTQTQNRSQLTDIYMPIFEDAQDATELKESTNVKTSLIQKTKDIDEVNTEIKNNVELSLKIDERSRVIPEVRNCDINVSNKCEALVGTIHDNSKLKNGNKESDIVTTVIISTGVQPNELHEESLVNAEELLSENTEQNQIYTTDKPHTQQIKALATSTPYKQVTQQVALEMDSKLAKADHSDICVSSTNNTSAPPNEDIPDIRIFIKRRRRLVKPAK